MAEREDLLAAIAGRIADYREGDHWNGRAPMLDDDADIDGKPCAMCGRDIAPADLVRLRVQRPAGPVKRPEFDQQSLPLHFDCLAAVSTSRLF